MAKNIYDEDFVGDSNDSKELSDLKTTALKKKMIYDEYDKDFDIEGGNVYIKYGLHGDGEAVDFARQVRAIRKYNPDIKVINLIMSTPGGSVPEMIGIVDYMRQLKSNFDIDVNVIVRGQAMSAGAIILALGTGVRMASKNSMIMFHEMSKLDYGKVSDLQSALTYLLSVQDRIYKMLEEKPKKILTSGRVNLELIHISLQKKH